MIDFHGRAGRVCILRRSISILAVIGALGASGTAWAQAAPADPTASPTSGEADDIIVVTGTRASLANSLNLKRNADSIVDSISAEDIGKFPDANMAEAIQRIPGVAIDRSGGEGRFVSINGLGPEFAAVLVNGRAVANDNPDRSFSFDTIASELVKTVNVYKSANANLTEGGIGGSIDVITAKPFDYKGFVLTGKVGALREDNSGKTGPQGSFLISDKFMGGRLGVLASFTYSERHNRIYSSLNDAIIPNIFFDPGAYAYVADSHQDAFRMQDLERKVTDETRRRIGGTLTVQYEPSDKLLFTLDYLYSRFDVTSISNSAYNYFYAVIDDADDIRDSNGVYSQFDHASGMNLTGYAYIHAQEYRPVQTHQIGFNTRWNPTDTLTGVFDLSGSRAINDNRGLDQFSTVEALGQAGFLVKTDGGVPYLQGANPFVPSSATVGALRARINSDSGTYTKSENWQARGDFTFNATDRIRLDFGASFASARKQNEFWQTPNPVRRLYQDNGRGIPLPAGVIAGYARPGDVFGNSLLNGDMFLISADALRAFMADPANLAKLTGGSAAADIAAFQANGNSWAAVKSGDSYSILERVTSGYVDVHATPSLLGRALDIVAGVRFTHTRLSSEGSTRVLIDLVQANPPGQGNSGILTPTFAATASPPIENSYTNFLPSLNVRWDFARDMVLRLGVAKTLTRPTLEDLAPSFNYTSLFAATRTATGNNPQLKPFTSFNIDASYEWYYRKDSGISLAYFHKGIKDYIVSTVAVETFANLPAGFQTFNVTRPRNAESAVVNGVTASWLHSFDFGLGFQANYTHVRGSVSSRSDPSQNFLLPGVSDTANVVGFFERGPFGARLAYNWRDSFVAQPNYGGQTNSPRIFRPYYQFDARISLAVAKGTVLALDAVNLTRQKVYSHGIDENAFISYADYGRQFTLTLSKKF